MALTDPMMREACFEMEILRCIHVRLQCVQEFAKDRPWGFKKKNKGGLGFWDLILFNKTLLAKQVWRLTQHHDSLVAKIFKAKYHSFCLVLEAGIRKKPSLV